MVVSASIGERVKRSERRQKTAYGGGIHKGGGSLPLCKLAFEVNERAALCAPARYENANLPSIETPPLTVS